MPTADINRLPEKFRQKADKIQAIKTEAVVKIGGLRKRQRHVAEKCLKEIDERRMRQIRESLR